MEEPAEEEDLVLKTEAALKTDYAALVDLQVGFTPQTLYPKPYTLNPIP